MLGELRAAVAQDRLPLGVRDQRLAEGVVGGLGVLVESLDAQPRQWLIGRAAGNEAYRIQRVDERR